MFKFICLLLSVVAASLTNVFAITDAERTALRNEIAECFTEHSVNTEQLEDAKNSRSTSTIQPCFIKCALMKVSLVDESGQYTPEKGLPVLAKFFSSEQDMANFEAAAQNCMKVNEANLSGDNASCERAKLVIDCAIEQNLEIPV